MINYEKVAEKIFAIIKGHGFNLSMFTQDGMDTSEPEDGRRFYVKKPNFMITLDEENDEIKINKNSNVTLEEIESILKQMKNLAKQNLLNTQVKVFGKEIAPKDFAYQAKKYRNEDMSEMNEASLSRMTGSKKTSYQTLESVKMIVRHKKAVDEDVRGSRSRQIQAIFLEQAGERFRFPHNNLAGARAMARHMYEGGNIQDQLGEYIIESVGNLQKLVEFVRYTRTNKLINETSEDIIKTIKENISTIRKEFKGLTGAKSYHAMSEAIAAREEQVLEEDDTIDLQDIFTVRKFDEKIGDMLPLVRKLMNEKQAWRTALIEASKQTILMHKKEELAEEDIMEFENPVQQVGYKIGKVAKRMVENGDLSKFVNKVASKLIEGETISDFEKTIVRNVLENAKITESGQCDKCGCYDCTCEINENTLENITDAFELKMKMIEHEDIFEELSASEKQDLKNELRRIRAKGLHRKGSPEFNRIREIKKKLGQKLRGVNEGDWDDAVRAGPAAPRNALKDCPNCHGRDADCDRCAGAGVVSDEKVNEEPGDWDHGYNYEGPQRDDDLGYDPKTQWMDPAGGIHDNDEDDPAAMYEDDYADCERCEGTGSESAAGNPLARNFDDDKCTLCGGSGQTDYVKGSRQDPFGSNYGVDPEDFMDEEYVEEELTTGKYAITHTSDLTPDEVEIGEKYTLDDNPHHIISRKSRNHFTVINTGSGRAWGVAYKGNEHLAKPDYFDKNVNYL